MTQETTYLDGLNTIQRAAVTTIDGPVLVVAGPGSGKTRVLTYRIARIIESGVAPYNILALTFTNKAAREMKERIEKVVGEKANQVWAGTFHSIFAKILRVEAAHLGYPSNFTIYDSDDSKSVLKAIVKDMQLDPENYNPNTLKNRISSFKANLVSPKGYLAKPELLDQDKQAKRPQMGEVYTRYANKCKQSGAMDFDDLMYQFFFLLYKNKELRKKYQQKFTHLLVDEFQDTNMLQYQIIRLLVDYEGSPSNVCAVGDDAQSIYGFRGATIENILEFESDFKKVGIKVFKLEQNYRSTEHIVQAANEIITQNAKQIKKTIRSEKGDGEKIKVIKAASDSDEGKKVVDVIMEQKMRHHLANKDIAILYRTNAQSRIFEEHLRRYNIPYKVFGGVNFYQRKEVKDALAYLRLAVNPADEEALKRVINFPKRGIGQATIDKIEAFAAQEKVPIYQVLKHADTGSKGATLRAFAELMDQFKKAAEKLDAYEAALEILDKCGLTKLLKEDKTAEGEGRYENYTALLNGIRDFTDDDTADLLNVEEDAERNLANYLQNIALVTDIDKMTEDGNYVSLMSIHAAKGLEYPSVIVVGLEDKLFPSFMAIKNGPDAIDEERRLFYVAVTRAEAFLTLSFANSRYHFGKIAYNDPSMFLTEIGDAHMDYPYAMKKELPTKDKDKPARASVKGITLKRRQPMISAEEMSNFKPSPVHLLKPGAKILHLKFGKGLVRSIDGDSNAVATIHFEDIDEEKRIALKFSKLQIL